MKDSYFIYFMWSLDIYLLPALSFISVSINVNLLKKKKNKGWWWFNSTYIFHPQRSINGYFMKTWLTLNNSKIPLCIHEMGKMHKIWMISSIGKVVQKWVLSYTLLEVLEPLWRALGSAAPLLGIYPWETHTFAHRGNYDGVYGGFVIAKHWKPSKCPSIQEWLDKLHAHPMEYYIVTEKHEMYLFVLHE